MNVLLRLIMTILMLATFSTHADVVIVVNKDNVTDISKDDITRLYLGKSVAYADGSKAKPMMLSVNTQEGEYFAEKVLSKSRHQYKAYWSKLIFTGKGTPPMEHNTPEQMIEAVRQYPEAIGLLPEDRVDDTVTVVMTF